MKRFIERLRKRLSGSSINFDPRVVGDRELVALVERQRTERGYASAIPADAWSEDITKRNTEIAQAYEQETARRTALLERGEYTPRFGSVENDMTFEMRTANVTGQQPRYPLLTPPESRDARTISGLTTRIQAAERTLEDQMAIPSRPSKREVLDAAGGDPQRAAQVEARLDELYGAQA